jgi:hypothetical protein
MSLANPTTRPIRAPVSGQARLTIEEAFDRFATTVTPEDRHQFQDTRLEDVRLAALRIEEELATRRSLRNMRRLYPFLQGLEHYSKAIEVLCNGTPFLPWIWVGIFPKFRKEGSDVLSGPRQAHASSKPFQQAYSQSLRLIACARYHQIHWTHLKSSLKHTARLQTRCRALIDLAQP